MPSNYRRPGTFVEEVLLPQQVQALGLDVSVGAFAGRTERGPVSTPTYVSSWTEFSRLFGVLKDSSGNPYWTAYAVYQFFGNGGRGCYVSRVAASDSLAAKLTLNDGTATPQDVLVVSASSPGDWAIASPNGSGIAIRVEEATPRFTVSSYRVDNGVVTLTTSIPHGFSAGDVINLVGINATGLSGEFAVTGAGTTSITFSSGTASNAGDTTAGGAYVSASNESFSLSVFYNGVATGYLVEKFNDLSLDPASARYAISLVNSQSKYVTLSRPAGFVAPTSGSRSIYRAPATTGAAVGLAKPATVTSIPAATVTAASISGTGVASLTATGHALQANDVVTVTGLSGVTLPGSNSLNGTYTVASVSGSTFSFNKVIQSNINSKVTLTAGGVVGLSSSHLFSVGNVITIAGTGDSNFDTTGRTLTAVTQSSTTVNVTASTASGASNTITVAAGDASKFWVGQPLTGVTSTGASALNANSYVVSIASNVITLNANAVSSASANSVASVVLAPAVQFGTTLTSPTGYAAVSAATATFTLASVSSLSGSASGVRTVSTSGSLDGSGITKADLIAAADDFDTVGNNLVYNIPDAASLTPSDCRAVYAAVISAAEARGDSFVVVDTPAGLDPTSAQSFSADVTPKSNSAAIYYPWLNIADPSSSGQASTRSVPPGGSVVGLYLATDASRGVFKAPAGLGANLSNVVSLERSFSSSDLDALNTALTPVNAIRQVPGAGICVMGARNVGADRRMKYVPTRRTMLQVKKRLQDLTAFAVFEPNDERLWERVRNVCGTYLRELWQQGGLKGATQEQAFFVKCDATNNTPTSLADGELNIEVGVALQNPAEFVVIRIGQFDGATSISVQ